MLDGLGIRNEIACVVDASQYARGKPAPDCFLEAARRIGAELVVESFRGGLPALLELENR